jgi:hypothetical protein
MEEEIIKNVVLEQRHLLELNPLSQLDEAIMDRSTAN